MVTYSGFLDRFPEFIPHPSGIVLGAIAEASADVSESVFGANSDRAIKHLAAHIIALQLVQMGSQIGATDGKVYGKGLEATQYGQEYLRLLNSQSLSIGFVV